MMLLGRAKQIAAKADRKTKKITAKNRGNVNLKKQTATSKGLHGSNLKSVKTPGKRPEQMGGYRPGTKQPVGGAQERVARRTLKKQMRQNVIADIQWNKRPHETSKSVIRKVRPPYIPTLKAKGLVGYIPSKIKVLSADDHLANQLRAISQQAIKQEVIDLTKANKVKAKLERRLEAKKVAEEQGLIRQHNKMSVDQKKEHKIYDMARKKANILTLAATAATKKATTMRLHKLTQRKSRGYYNDLLAKAA